MHEMEEIDLKLEEAGENSVVFIRLSEGIDMKTASDHIGNVIESKRVSVILLRPDQDFSVFKQEMIDGMVEAGLEDKTESLQARIRELETKLSETKAAKNSGPVSSAPVISGDSGTWRKIARRRGVLLRDLNSEFQAGSIPDSPMMERIKAELD